MRIVQFADYGGAYAGSFIPMLRALTRAARARGHDVDLAFSPTARGQAWLAELHEDSIPVRFSPTMSRDHLRTWISELLCERDIPTVLHTHFTAFDVPAVQAAKCARKAAVFWHVHSRARPELSAGVGNVVKLLLFGRQVAGILCVAPDIASAMRRRFAPRNRVTFFPNAIDVDRFSPQSRASRAAARRELGLPSDGQVLLHLGWDWHRKGGDLFLGAAKLLVRTYPSVTAVTVGGGADARALTGELGLEPCVRVLGPTDRVQILYAAADVFVSSSRAEGMPFAVAEALCSGIPVVATDIPGHAAIGAGLDACRITHGDRESLAAGVADILDRPASIMLEQARVAREHVQTTMDLDGWSSRLVDLYERAM